MPTKKYIECTVYRQGGGEIFVVVVHVRRPRKMVVDLAFCEEYIHPCAIKQNRVTESVSDSTTSRDTGHLVVES